jgi:hypothetical protein
VYIKKIDLNYNYYIINNYNMGIKNFRTNIIEQFPDIISNKKPNNIHTLCIDLNGILHKVCHRAKNKEQFKKSLFNKLKKLLRIIKPKSIAIFVDGQAILAKANTQIKRRNKYLYSESSGVSSLNLTPGTPFMEYIDSSIKEFLDNLNITTYYSSSKENNEGEIKVFEWLLSNNIKTRTCILGSDSDIIVLALASRPLLDLYIYDEDKYLSFFKLIEKLSGLYNKKFSYNWHPVRLDFALLSLLQGNDYNNKVSDFKKLLKSYTKLQSKKNIFLIKKNGDLNLINIKKLFSNIETTYPITCTSNDVNEYFKAIKWNLDLYQQKLNTRFIPNYSDVNINSIIKFMPETIESVGENINWLNPDVFTLLLMPSTGKDLLPNHLKHFLEEGSPIKDLFPDPCPICIKWKQKLREIIKPDDNASENELNNYKKLLSTTSVNYSNHIKEFHSNTELPIERLENAVINTI